MRPGPAERRAIAKRQRRKFAWVVSGLALFAVAVAAPGHGPLDEFADRADGELPKVEDVLSADFVPDGCAELPSCRASALLVAAHMSGNPINRLPRTPFTLYLSAGVGTWGLVNEEYLRRTHDVESPPEFLKDNAVFANSWGYLDATVFVEGTYVGAIRYGETGAELFDWLDGAQYEFNPKSAWRINGDVEKRFAAAVENAYRTARRRQVNRLEIDSEKVHDALGLSGN